MYSKILFVQNVALKSIVRCCQGDITSTVGKKASDKS